MKNKSISIFSLFFFLFFVAIVFQSKFYRLHSSADIYNTEEEELVALASAALKTLDVPVGSLVVYDGKIIGRGFNTVNRDINLAGHAEINALNDAVKSRGLKQFNALDRDKLVLISTFEPCEMCKGAMIHYDVKKVIFLKEKPLTHWWKKQYKSIRYEWKKKNADGAQIQDSLFHLHPDYPGNK